MSGQSTAVRFRHSAGDLGPLIFSPSANIQTVKERLLAEWPRGVHGLFTPRPGHHMPGNGPPSHCWACLADGSMGSDAPSCVADMKLILGGKFLDNSESLEGTLRCPPLPPPTAGSTISSGVSCTVLCSGSARSGLLIITLPCSPACYAR